MNRDTLEKAMEHISDQHIAEAAKAKKRRPYWLGAVAAAAILAIVLSSLGGPMVIDAKAISLASDPRVTQWSLENLDAWRAEWDVRNATTDTALAQLKNFFTDSSEIFMSGTENKLWSPANAYIGLAMLAEITASNSRQQILDLFGADSIETLRTQVSAIWESVYTNNGNEISTLANSLWLENGLNYNQETMDALAYHYYASVYQGDLGSDTINKAIGAWLNNNTGGLLKNYADKTNLSQEAILALYSTLYFQAKWEDEFEASQNTKDLFHCPDADVNATYMNKKEAMMFYYWGDTFGAVALSLKNGSQMWFVLPDEGQSIDDVLADGQYMDMILPGIWENSKYMKVNLSVPKFDVSGQQNLAGGLQKLGITEVFSPDNADFSGITADVPVFLTAANQAVRVQIDEQGVKAAAYIELPGATSPAPPEEIIDFVLDRPFLFVITRNNIPLFAGAVNEP